MWLLLLLSCVRPVPDLGARAIGLDARLSSLPYPYDTHVLPLVRQGHDVELVYMDEQPAEPNGRTVVLLHGKNFSGAYWAPMMQALLVAGFRVVVPDQIGFGKSSKPVDVQY